MNKSKFFLFLFIFFVSFNVLSSQIDLFNETNKPISFSFKFFHTKANNKMLISGFVLKPGEKTRFPRDSHLFFAKLVKLKVYWLHDLSSVISKKFNQNDSGSYLIKVINSNGKLNFVDITN